MVALNAAKSRQVRVAAAGVDSSLRSE